MNKSRIQEEKIVEVRRRVQIVFKELRMQGFIAKANFPVA